MGDVRFLFLTVHIVNMLQTLFADPQCMQANMEAYMKVKEGKNIIC